MEFQIVRLETLPKEKILEFWRSKKDLYGQPLDMSTAALERKYSIIFDIKKANYHMYGVLDARGELIFSLGANLWQGLPYYSFIDFYLTPSLRRQNQIVKLMTLGIGQIMRDMYQQGRHTFFYVFKRDHVSEDVEWGDARVHSCYKHLFAESHKYDFTTELIVPPGVRPPFSTYWKLIGERTHNIELSIRKGCLKPQYMKELLLSNSTSSQQGEAARAIPDTAF